MGLDDRRWLLVGGIGSGKSAVRKLLADRGVRTIDADAIGHLVLDQEALQSVGERWPDVILEGKVDRKMLAAVVFGDSTELAQLESITHPFIFGRIRSELEGFPGLAVVEMPILESALGWPLMVVDARDETRIERAVARGMGRADVERRMAAQPTRAEWLAAAEIVVPNHGTLGELEQTVDEVVKYLRL
ncbi:MAG: dephospho-CoA kinase [Acidimicrobiia bacterium]